MIGMAVEKNGQVYIYDEKNNLKGTIFLGGGSLAGFNAKCLCIKKGSQLLIFDDKKRQTANIALGGGEVVGCADKIGIKRGSTIYLYDEKGKAVGTKIG